MVKSCMTSLQAPTSKANETQIDIGVRMLMNYALCNVQCNVQEHTFLIGLLFLTIFFYCHYRLGSTDISCFTNNNKKTIFS